MKRAFLGLLSILTVLSSCAIMGPIEWPEFASPWDAWIWIVGYTYSPEYPAHIEYKTDFEVHGVLEEWQTPEETLDRRTGDCDDRAILMQEFCHRMGVHCDVAIVWLPDLDVLWPAHMTPIVNGEFIESWVKDSRKSIVKIYTYEEIQEILHPRRAPGGKR